jgi:Flp pilus assembly protein TadD
MAEPMPQPQPRVERRAVPPRVEPDWSRVRAFLAGASSAVVVLLAFLIPSLQDQWDRRQTRIAVDRYVAVGERLLKEAHYASAEQSFDRAVELAGFQRYDLIEKQIRARVMRIYEDPAWRGATPEEVNEADYIYLIEAQDAPSRTRERAATLAAYGAFLASADRLPEAEARLKESAQLDPRNPDPHVHLGNLYDDLHRPADAEREYRAALAIEPHHASAQYDLGLLLLAQSRPSEAETVFRGIVATGSRDSDVRLGLIEALDAQGKRDAARAEADAARLSDPDNRSVAEAAERLSAGHPVNRPRRRAL